MPGNENRRVFTYQTRVSVTPEQDQMLREYAVRFGRVERTLYRAMQKGGDANRLKSDYLVRFAITARQFNAVRIQLQGRKSLSSCRNSWGFDSVTKGSECADHS